MARKKKQPTKRQEVRWKRSIRSVPSYDRPDPEVAHAEIERIADEHGGKATAADVVEESKPKDSPLHRCFDWNNKSASHKWRLHQARDLMGAIEIVILEEDPEGEEEQVASAPAFVSIERNEEDGAGYRSITLVMDDPGLKDKLIKQAWRELQSWLNRYNHLTEFATIHDAIRSVKKVS